MARALPRVASYNDDPINFYDYFERWLDKLPVHKLDERLNASLSKFLRKIRVVVMKVDNKLVHNLTKLRKNGESNGDSIGYVKDLLDQINNGKKE